MLIPAIEHELTHIDPEDSHMLGSSSSSDDEAMFPSAETEPTSSAFHDSLAAVEHQAPGLSPPHSQELHDAMDTAEGNGPELNGADQLLDAAQNIDPSNGWEPKSEFAKSAEMMHEPGSCWNNKKAREEWQKAWNQIEDKNFSLSEYFREGGEDSGSLPLILQRTLVTLSTKVRRSKKMGNENATKKDSRIVLGQLEL